MVEVTNTRMDSAIKMGQFLAVVVGVVISVVSLTQSLEKDAAARLAEAQARKLEIEKFNHQRQVEQVSRRIEATKPFLDRQLKLYTKATQVAATLATSDDEDDRASAGRMFWSLYWGELALVEDWRVETAMAEFGRAFQKEGSGPGLQQHAIALAHACRDSLAESWGVEQWRKPYFRNQ